MFPYKCCIKFWGDLFAQISEEIYLPFEVKMCLLIMLSITSKKILAISRSTWRQWSNFQRHHISWDFFMHIPCKIGETSFIHLQFCFSLKGRTLFEDHGWPSAHSFKHLPLTTYSREIYLLFYFTFLDIFFGWKKL